MIAGRISGLPAFLCAAIATMLMTMTPGIVPARCDTGPAVPAGELNSRSVRLPDSAAPVRYDLRFSPDLVAATFEASETIVLDVFKPLSTITLNAAELKVSRAALRSTRQAAQPITK